MLKSLPLKTGHKRRRLRLSIPVHANDTVAFCEFTNAAGAVHEHATVRELEMRQIACGISIRDSHKRSVATAQLFEAADFLLATPVRCREAAIEAVRVPRDLGTDRFGKAQVPRDGRHVQVGTRAHEHQMISRLPMRADLRERVAKRATREEPRHESFSPSVKLRACA